MALAVLAAAAYWALGHSRWEAPALALAAVGVTPWTLLNTPYEDTVLFIPFPANRFTAADALSGPAVVLLIARSWRAVRR